MTTKLFESMLIDPYYPKIPFKNFLDLDEQLQKNYDHLIDDLEELKELEITPRYIYEHGLKIGFRDTFYYIDRLYDTAPKSVIDVGCGECIWKKWFPNIIGFDPVHRVHGAADFIDFFDEVYSANHKEHYDCGMALNSLHFVSWTEISRQIDLAMNIIRPGGRFLFTFNFQMLNFYTPAVKTSIDENIIKMHDIIKELNFNIVLLDFPHVRVVNKKLHDNYCHINGHVRFILEK
jgi:hypothetical protein